MDIKNDIRDFIQSDLLRGRDVPLGPRDSLINAGIIDSLGIQKLLEFLERTFAVKISDDEIVPENFETIDSITDLIEAKVSG